MSEPSVAIASRSDRSVGTTAFSRRVTRYLVAFALYLLLNCLFFAPLIAHPNSRVLQGFGDATEGIRDYDVMAAAGSTPYTFRHDALNGAPEGMPMLPQTQIAQPAQSAAVWVLRGVTGTVAAFNIFFFAGILLTAIAGFALLDWAGLGMVPSLFGGFVVAFNPWMIERAAAGHVAFVHGWTLILLLAALTKLRGARTLRWAAIAGLAYGVCFLFSAYMGLIATSLVAAFVIVDLCTQDSWTERLWTGSLLVVIGGVALLFLAPALVAVALDREAVSTGLSHAATAAQAGGARPSDYLLPLPRHPLLGFIGRTRGRERPPRESRRRLRRLGAGRR